MNYTDLGNTGLRVSRLSFGASALGGVFGPVDEAEGIRAVHAALDCGINYFDVAPSYGDRRSEAVLGKALRGIARNRYILSTKVGKYRASGEDRFDYSRDGIRASIEESARRLGVDYFDIVHLHDIEYRGRQYTESALSEGYAALCELKRIGWTGAVGFGIYPVDLWKRVLLSLPLDAALIHNHYCLHDTQLVGLLPLARDRGVGVINGSPFGSGLLSAGGPASWHPAQPADLVWFRQAADFCRRCGVSLSQLALQFASQHPDIPTTLFSAASAESVLLNVRWHDKPYDRSMVAQVVKILDPVRNKEWEYR